MDKDNDDINCKIIKDKTLSWHDALFKLILIGDSCKLRFNVQASENLLCWWDLLKTILKKITKWLSELSLDHFWFKLRTRPSNYRFGILLVKSLSKVWTRFSIEDRIACFWFTTSQRRNHLTTLRIGKKKSQWIHKIAWCFSLEIKLIMKIAGKFPKRKENSIKKITWWPNLQKLLLKQARM